MKTTIRFLIFLIAATFSFRAFSQDAPPDPPEPDKVLLYEKGALGKLPNRTNFPLLGDTYFHGPVPFYAASYFPYLQKAGDGLGPDFNEFLDIGSLYPLPIPGTTGYHTAFALASVLSPVTLTPNIEVVGWYRQSASDGGKLYSLASLVLPGQVTYDPDFSDLEYNQHHPPAGYQHPFKGWGKYAVSCLEAAQKFTNFTFIHLGWAGFDRFGQKAVTILLQGGPGSKQKDFPTRYSHEQQAVFMQSIKENDPENPGFGELIRYEDGARDVVGHEISHGILRNALGNSMWNPINENTPTEFWEMQESFCDIMGLSSLNYNSPGGFNNPKWVYSHNMQFPDIFGTRSFSNPKNYFSTYGFLPPNPGGVVPRWCHPNTYKGLYYKNLADSDWSPHNNGAILSYWFYLLVTGKSGNIDDNPAQESYAVMPIDPTNPSKSWMKALKIVFEVFTNGMSSYLTTYENMRENTLAEAVNQGYPIGSYEYIQIANAWHAVGVGPKIDYNQDHNPNCNSGLSIAGETTYNGLKNFNAIQYTLTDNPQSPKVSKLQECSTSFYPAISTRQKGDKAILDFNGDGKFLDEFVKSPDDVYSIINDMTKSKAAVSVHWGTEYALSWYKNMFSQYGIDAAGSEIKNIMVPQNDNIFEPVFSTADKKISYNLGSFVSLDYIGKVLTEAIYYSRWGKIDRNADGTSKYPEAEAVRGSVSDIMGLSIYNHQLLANSKPATWTFGNDHYVNDNVSTPYDRSFIDPKAGSKFHPNYYKGNFYKNNPNYENSFAANYAPHDNNGVLNFWYYLLVNGTGDDPNGKTTELGEKYFVYGIGEDDALKIVWRAFNEHLNANPTFEDFKTAVYDAIISAGYGNKSIQMAAAHDAFFAIGLEQKRFQDLLHMSPAYGETVTECWPVEFRVEVKFPIYESDRVFEVSEDKTFGNPQYTVYRFKNYASPDEAISETLASAKLEQNKEYWWRSRLIVTPGEPDCPSGLSNPQICAQLRNKYDWTEPIKFKTGPIPAPGNPIPSKGAKVAAWSTHLSWKQVKGADGYITNIKDGKGIVPLQEEKESVSYTEDDADVIKHEALAKENDYSWRVGAWAKTGSAQGVKHSGSAIPDDYVALSQAEKDAFIDANGEFTEETAFVTDIPTTKLKAPPASGDAVAPFGTPLTLSCEVVEGADAYGLRLNSDEDGLIDNIEQTDPFKTYLVVPKAKHDKDYTWDYTPIKEKTPPFILEKETGSASEKWSFKIDNKLAPGVKINEFECTDKDADVNLSWVLVPGAVHYKYEVFHEGSSIAKGTTPNVQVNVPGVSSLQKKYHYEVTPVGKDADGNLIEGHTSESFYQVRKGKVTDLFPINVTNHGGSSQQTKGIDFSWNCSWAPAGYLFSIKMKNGEWISKEVTSNVVNVKGLLYDTKYEWSVKALGVCSPTPQHGEFETYSLGQNKNKPISIEEEAPTDGNGGHDDGGNGGNTGSGNTDPGTCPGYFQVSITNSDKLQLSILHNVLGSVDVQEGSNDLNTNQYQAYLANGGFYYPSGYSGNDEIVMHIKVKSLNIDWYDIATLAEIPVITITTSKGKVMTHVFSGSDWFVDKEIFIGTYKCTEH
jgi:Zn-dependent metalloprotease